jgi:hypothetical protein
LSARCAAAAQVLRAVQISGMESPSFDICSISPATSL